MILSRRAIQRRVVDISGNLCDQLKQPSKQLKYYSLVMDEGKDRKDTAQHIIFIRGVSDETEIVEELTDMYSMKGKITGKEIAQEVNKCLVKKLENMKI